MKRMVMAWVLALGLISFLSTVALAQSQPGAVALESRLYAPCCWGGTLDVHDSELARELRKEIEGRLARGETSDAIQADFVARYGDRVLAARSEAPIRAMGLWSLAMMVVSGLGLAFVVRRWARQPRRGPSDAPEPVKRDALDDRLDAELADHD